MCFRRFAGVLTALMVIAFGAGAAAQEPTALQLPLEFDFVSPGARSLAMGSTFAAIADDASAAYTNPAGLVFLTRPEASFEGRYRTNVTRFLERGRLTGAPAGIGIDTLTGPLFAEANDRLRPFTPAFASVVLPRGRWVIAGYRQESLSFDLQLQDQGIFRRTGSFDRRTGSGSRITRRANLDNYGVAGAFRVSSKLAIGAAIVASHLDLESSVEQFFLPPTLAGLFSEQRFLREDEYVVESLEANGWKAVPIVSVLVEPHKTVRIGLVARTGASFALTETRTYLEPAASARAFPSSSVPLPETSSPGSLRVPTVVNVGASWRPVDVFVATAEFARVLYSSLNDEFVSAQAPDFPITQALDNGQFTVTNGPELHAGVEYVLGLKYSPALRAGVWLDPNHNVEYAPQPETGEFASARAEFNQYYSPFFPERDDRWHYSMGLGLSISSRFEINAAADFATDKKTVSTSAVVRF